ncbi:hypothetical protein ACTA71_009387 [Dictyostelium dimigraforme]
MINQQNFINNINKLITIENHNNTNKSKTFIKRINNLITYENSNNYRKHPNNDSNTIITELMISPIPQNTFITIKKRTYKIVNKNKTFTEYLIFVSYSLGWVPLDVLKKQHHKQIALFEKHLKLINK